MTLQDLERLTFLLRSRLALPDVLAAPLEAAIVSWLQDPAVRSLDYWLALPPRAPSYSCDFSRQRNGLYQDLAGTMHGSTNRRSEIISEHIEIWLEGESSPETFGAPFEKFLREYRELEVPHLKQTALRAVITPKSCQ